MKAERRAEKKLEAKDGPAREVEISRDHSFDDLPPIPLEIDSEV
jgi:hypothetical protein